MEGRVFIRSAHGELVHVGPPEQHGVGRLEPRDDRRVVGWRKFSSIREAQVIGSPCVDSTSLTATGSPASRPSGLPAVRRRSICSAWASAAGRSTRKNALTVPSCRAMRSNKTAAVSSTEVTSPVVSCWTSSAVLDVEHCSFQLSVINSFSDETTDRLIWNQPRTNSRELIVVLLTTEN